MIQPKPKIYDQLSDNADTNGHVVDADHTPTEVERPGKLSIVMAGVDLLSDRILGEDPAEVLERNRNAAPRNTGLPQDAGQFVRSPSDPRV